MWWLVRTAALMQVNRIMSPRQDLGREDTLLRPWRRAYAKHHAYSWLPAGLAAVGPGRRHHAGGLCHSRLAGLRNACRSAARSRPVRLSDRRSRLCAGRLLALPRDRANLRGLADD